MYDIDKEVEGDATTFLGDANNAILGRFAFIEFALDKSECFDGAWLFRTENSDEVFALFVDCKSAAIQSIEETVTPQESYQKLLVRRQRAMTIIIL